MPKTESRKPVKEMPRGRRKPKKFEEVEDDEDDTNFEALPRWKLMLIGAIVILCFALLYPSVFGPILNSLLGRGSTPPNTLNSNTPPVHPALNRQGGGASGRPHMHPAASARMPHVEAQQPSGRSGMFTWMLPIYTIGVMGFLCYTLFKIMFKSKKKKNKRGRRTYSSDEDTTEEDNAEMSGMNHTRLRSLQSRLHETEAAMSKILEQLESISQTPSSEQVAPETIPDEKKADQADKMTPEQLKNIEASMQKLTELSKLYKKQKAQLDASDDEQDVGSSEDEVVDEEVDDVQHPEELFEPDNPDTDDEGISENASEEETKVFSDRISPNIRRRPKRE